MSENDDYDNETKASFFEGVTELARAEHDAIFAVRRLRIVEGDLLDGYEPVKATAEEALMSIGPLYGPELRALLTELEDIDELPAEAERLRAAIWPFIKAYDVMGTLTDEGL